MGRPSRSRIQKRSRPRFARATQASLSAAVAFASDLSAVPRPPFQLAASTSRKLSTQGKGSSPGDRLRAARCPVSARRALSRRYSLRRLRSKLCSNQASNAPQAIRAARPSVRVPQPGLQPPGHPTPRHRAGRTGTGQVPQHAEKERRERRTARSASRCGGPKVKMGEARLPSSGRGRRRRVTGMDRRRPSLSWTRARSPPKCRRLASTSSGSLGPQADRPWAARCRLRPRRPCPTNKAAVHQCPVWHKHGRDRARPVPATKKPASRPAFQIKMLSADYASDLTVRT